MMVYKSTTWTRDEHKRLKTIVESRKWKTIMEASQYIVNTGSLDRSPQAVFRIISKEARLGNIIFRWHDGRNSYNNYLESKKEVDEKEKQIKHMLTYGGYTSMHSAARDIVEKLDLKVGVETFRIWAEEREWPFEPRDWDTADAKECLERSFENRAIALSRKADLEEYDGGKLILKSSYKPKIVEGDHNIGDKVKIKNKKGVIVEEYPYFYLVDVGPYQTALNKV